MSNCLTTHATADNARKDLAEARRLSVGSTPTFLIGRVQPEGEAMIVRRLSGAVDLATFQDALDAVIQPTYPWYGRPIGMFAGISLLAGVGTMVVRRMRRKAIAAPA